MADLQTVPLSEVIARLGTSAKGLSRAEASEPAAPRRAERDHPETAHPSAGIRPVFLGADPVDDRGGWPGYSDAMGWDVELVAHAPATAPCGSASTATVRNARRTFAASSSVPHRLANTRSLSTHYSPIANPLGELAASMPAKRIDAERRPL